MFKIVVESENETFTYKQISIWFYLLPFASAHHKPKCHASKMAKQLFTG